MNSISYHITRAKEKDLCFYVLKNFYKNSPTRRDFNKYISEHNVSGGKPEVIEEHFYYFNNWTGLLKDLSTVYPDTHLSYTSLIWTDEKDISVGGTELHNDPSDVIHINCYGSVEWNILDKCQNMHTFVLNDGDALYLKQGTMHSTRVISPRGSLIYMPYRME